MKIKVFNLLKGHPTDQLEAWLNIIAGVMTCLAISIIFTIISTSTKEEFFGKPNNSTYNNMDHLTRPIIIDHVWP